MGNQPRGTVQYDKPEGIKAPAAFEKASRTQAQAITVPKETVDGPVQLISISKDLKKFEAKEEGLRLLRSIEGDIGIVSVAGVQRTGKSFLLNLLLDRFK